MQNIEPIRQKNRKLYVSLFNDNDDTIIPNRDEKAGYSFNCVIITWKKHAFCR